MIAPAIKAALPYVPLPARTNDTPEDLILAPVQGKSVPTFSLKGKMPQNASAYEKETAFHTTEKFESTEQIRQGRRRGTACLRFTRQADKLCPLSCSKVSKVRDGGGT